MSATLTCVAHASPVSGVAIETDVSGLSSGLDNSAVVATVSGIGRDEVSAASTWTDETQSVVDRRTSVERMSAGDDDDDDDEFSGNAAVSAGTKVLRPIELSVGVV